MGSSPSKEKSRQAAPPELDEESEFLRKEQTGQKMLNSIIEHDKDAIDNGKLVNEALDNSISSFVPDLMFEQLVKNYSMAKNIYGKKLLQQITGYDDKYIEKNIKIPEFQREIKKAVEKRLNKLKKEKIIGKKGEITDKGVELASLVMYTEELDKINPHGFSGEKTHKRISVHGDKQEIKQFSKSDRYRDISVHRSVKTAIRRGHRELMPDDIKVFRRKSKGEIYIIYALDASGSMRGDKISNCKRAGVALCYRAIEKKDKVGLIVFGKDIQKRILPTKNFPELLREITTIRASSETDIAKTLKSAIQMFPQRDVSKHLVLITDAMPTAGDEPIKETIEAAALAKASRITISLVGIKLGKDAAKLAKKITDIGSGKLHIVKNTENVDQIVLDDYEELRSRY